MDLNRFIIFLAISIIMGIGKKFLRFTLKILVIGIAIVAVVIYRETIIDLIRGFIESGDKLSFLI